VKSTLHDPPIDVVVVSGSTTYLMPTYSNIRLPMWPSNGLFKTNEFYQPCSTPANCRIDSEFFKSKDKGEPDLFEIYMPSNTPPGYYQEMVVCDLSASNGTLRYEFPISVHVQRFRAPIGWIKFYQFLFFIFNIMISIMLPLNLVNFRFLNEKWKERAKKTDNALSAVFVLFIGI
jgi:hypothetical protein